MENLDRDTLSDRDTEMSESEKSESWRSEPSSKSSELKQESEKSEDIDNPACSGCQY
jgi:hypothetical protein